MSQHYKVTDRNPNDDAAGGCLCHDTKTSDVTGPFAVFYSTPGESQHRPHTVLCAPCARGVVGSLPSGRGAIADAARSSGKRKNRPPEATTIDLGDEDIIEI